MMVIFDDFGEVEVVMMIVIIVVITGFDGPSEENSFFIRYFSRWEEFVALVKARRINQEMAEEFRRFVS